MLLGAVCVLGLAAITGVDLRYRWRECGRLAVYGCITALHFFLYIWSLEFTTIAHSLSLVYTAPIFVTIFASVFLGESVPRRTYLGIPVVILGVAILSGLEPTIDSRMVFGDVLAIGSAICFGLYSVAGRYERTRQPLLRYAGGVYAAAALWLLVPAIVTFSGWHDLGPALAVAGLGILPLGIGHTLYNASLRRVHATYVNVIATQEVTGGVILGAIILREIPSWNSIVGAVVTLIGVLYVLISSGMATTTRLPAAAS